MMYAPSICYGILVGSVSGWFCYNTCMGSKKNRLRAGIMCGVGMGIIAVLGAIGA